jgi:hypothetical protein
MVMWPGRDIWVAQILEESGLGDAGHEVASPGGCEYN